MRDTPNRRGPIIGLVLLVLFAIGGYFIAKSIRDAGRVQDCVMSGRRDCGTTPP